MKKTIIVTRLIGLLICLPIIWPLLQSHFFQMQDYTHVARLSEMERGIADGQLPLRWSSNLGYGYGMPQFSFYGPMFYYIAYFFRLLTVSPIWSIKLAVIVQIIISYMALYEAGRILWGSPWSGLISGILGTYAPYRLMDFYVRGAFAELMGITFITVAIWAIISWAKNPRLKSTICVSLSLAGIALSHNLMTLIGWPFLFITALIFLWYFRHLSLKKIIVLIGIYLLGIGLSAFYAIPAFMEKGFTQADILINGYGDFHRHFIYIRQLFHSPWGYGGSFGGLTSTITFEVGPAQWAAIFLVIATIILRFIRHKTINRDTGLLISLLGIIGFCSFMTVYKSMFIWDHVPLLAYLQFPWRFLSLVIIFVGLTAGAVVKYVPTKFQFGIASLLIVIALTSQVGHCRPEKYLSDDTILYYTDPIKIQQKMSQTIPDYLPTTAKPSHLPIPVTALNKFQFTSDVKPMLEVNRGHEFLLTLAPHASTQFIARIFDFPGWTIYLNGKQLAHSITSEGLITAILPASSSQSFLSGKFEETPLRLFADFLSSISLISVGYLITKKG